MIDYLNSSNRKQALRAWATHRKRGTYIRPIYPRMTGHDYVAAGMLAELVYWLLPKDRGDVRAEVSSEGKFYIRASYRSWETRCGFTMMQARRALKALKDLGLVETEISKHGHQQFTHISLNEDKFAELWLQHVTEKDLLHVTWDEIDETFEDAEEVVTDNTGLVTDNTPPCYAEHTGVLQVTHHLVTDNTLKSTYESTEESTEQIPSYISTASGGGEEKTMDGSSTNESDLSQWIGDRVPPDKKITPIPKPAKREKKPFRVSSGDPDDFHANGRRKARTYYNAKDDTYYDEEDLSFDANDEVLQRFKKIGRAARFSSPQQARQYEENMAHNEAREYGEDFLQRMMAFSEEGKSYFTFPRIIELLGPKGERRYEEWIQKAWIGPHKRKDKPQNGTVSNAGVDWDNIVYEEERTSRHVPPA